MLCGYCDTCRPIWYVVANEVEHDLQEGMGSPRDLCLANLYAPSLPMMLVCALTFRIVT